MSIHHATLKKADQLGLTIEEIEGGIAVFPQGKPEQRITHPIAPAGEMVEAGRYAMLLSGEYPNLKLSPNDDFHWGILHENKWLAVHTKSKMANPAKAFEALLANALEIAQEQELDLGEAEEKADSGSVVSHRYKQIYAERGNPNHCGDWLAKLLSEICTLPAKGKKSSFDIEAFEDICNANGVDLAKYNRTSNGWQGRLRMAGRNRLIGKINEAGVLILPSSISFTGKDMELAIGENWSQHVSE